MKFDQINFQTVLSLSSSAGKTAAVYKQFSVLLHFNRSYAWLHHILKIHHQALFVRHFLKLLLPLHCFHMGILLIFTALGISSRYNLHFALSKWDFMIFARLMSSHIRAINLISSVKSFFFTLEHGGGFIIFVTLSEKTSKPLSSTFSIIM